MLGIPALNEVLFITQFIKALTSSNLDDNYCNILLAFYNLKSLCSAKDKF
jgi:hypothetical protein